MENDYQFADSAAARMLSQGLVRANEERGLSVRQLGKQLGYSQAVVLSHMANGRAPIPIDRAEQLADALKLDKKSFLQAVVQQRHPSVSWHLLSGGSQHSGSDNLPQELEAILGAQLKDLNKEQRAVMREVASDPSPRRRWLTVHEVPTVQELRAMYPSMEREGIPASDLAALRALSAG
ncbi:helix-turn-helix transcriptional regulator [Altererythrobacter sp. BO-6]|nr:helix-turn-helix transcriptional regulator [Altererythrobacter sp. BO-6]